MITGLFLIIAGLIGASAAVGGLEHPVNNNDWRPLL